MNREKKIASNLDENKETKNFKWETPKKNENMNNQ